MNRQTTAWLAVALLSISALGVSATTLESTMSTDANEVINLDYDQIPLGEDQTSKVLDEIEGKQKGTTASQPKTKPGSSSDSTSTQAAESGSGASKGGPRRQDSQVQRQQQQRSQDDGSNLSPEPPSLLDRLLALLTALLPYLLGLAALLGAVGLAVRYRDRLFALFARPDPPDPDGPTPSDEAGLLEGSPTHPVERAWLGMVQHLDLDRPGTMTTSECARAAVDAGLDREAVQTLTETYEEVRYGNQPVTERREQIALQSQRQLDVGGGA